MEPSESFDSWQAILLSTLTPGGEYKRLLPSLIILVDQVISHSVLDPPLSDKTAFFLSNVVKNVTMGILDMSYVDSFEAKLIREFLHSISRLVVWAAVHDMFDLVQVIISIFDCTANLYSRSWTPEPKSTLLRETMTFLQIPKS
jgi:hypothetical protein